MRSSVLLTITTLGLSLATIAAPSADAQARNTLVVCRDGTRFNSNDIRVCDGHRGIDSRATDVARRNNTNVNGTWDNRRDNRDDRRDARDDRRDRRDDRYGNNADPRYDPNNRNNDNRGYGNNRGYGYGNNSRREVYEWSGVVDKEVRIQLRGDRAFVQGMNVNDQRNSRGRMMGAVPTQTGNLVVQRLEGRGDVDVIEQPSARNGYTATLRIRDSQSGASGYRIAAYWEPPVGYGR